MRLDSDIIAWLKAVAAVIKPKQIGCCGTPCFISRKKRESVGEKSLRATEGRGEGKRMINDIV